MADDNNYNASQQPSTGYNSSGMATGTNYALLQSPGQVYGQASPGAGGGGSGAAPATPKLYELPDAETNWSSNKARFPAVSKLPLYEKKTPVYNQIQQQNIANCYLGATLASMANTKAGVAVIKKMIKSHMGAITTSCKRFDNNKPPGPVIKIQSDRWFTVSFRKLKVEVSDVLYHDDSDRNANLQYMTTPNIDKALWGAIIEVAYARLKGNYDNISANSGLTLINFLGEFCSLNWELLQPDKDQTKIREKCRSARTKPSFIATLTTSKILTPWHGYAVLGINGKKVKLWDPMAGKEESIEFEALLTEIQAVVASK